MAARREEGDLAGGELIREVCRRIRRAKALWDAGEGNAACRRERERALALYLTLEKGQRAEIPQPLRVWLRYRSEKYFGGHRTPPGTGYGKARSRPGKTGGQARRKRGHSKKRKGQGP